MIDIKLKLFRFNPDKDKKHYYKDYQLSVREGTTVLEALLEILETQDPTLSFRFSCRGAVCGSCAMNIQGKNRLACQTQVKEFKEKTIKVSPLPFLPIIKDLVVDMDNFFEKYEKIIPYLKTEYYLEKENLQTPKEREIIDEWVNCLLCGSCYSSCPSVWTNKDYLGPAALTKTYRFIIDSREKEKNERMKIINSENGLWRCHTIFNCVEACPKNINSTWAISELKKKSFFKK